MAGSKEIRTKIKSVQSTRKITKAMEMVAASKMRKAQERMRSARPYGDKIRNIVAHLANANPEYRHPFLEKNEVAKDVGVILVTSDKGLCGGMNTNVLRLLTAKVKEWQEEGRKVRFTAALVGEYVDPSTKRADHYRVYRGRSGKYVVHVERQAEYWTVNSEGKPAGWRGWVGVGDVKYGATPQESTLEVVGSLDELRDKLPQPLFDMVERSAAVAGVEDLDI